MRILLYAPALPGHPQVYCRVIGDILLEAGHEVVLASAIDEAGWPAQWPDLRPYAANPRVQIVDVRRHSAGGRPELSAEEMRTLQEDFRIDSTLLVEADYFAGELRRIADKQAPRLRGRTVAFSPGRPDGSRAKTITVARPNRGFGAAVRAPALVA